MQEIYKNAQLWEVDTLTEEYMDNQGDVWMELVYPQALLMGAIAASYRNFVILPNGAAPQMDDRVGKPRKVSRVKAERNENVHADKAWRKPEVRMVKRTIYQRGNDVIVE